MYNRDPCIMCAPVWRSIRIVVEDVARARGMDRYRGNTKRIVVVNFTENFVLNRVKWRGKNIYVADCKNLKWFIVL